MSRAIVNHVSITDQEKNVLQMFIESHSLELGDR